MVNKSVCSCCGLEYEIDDLMSPNFYSVCPHCYWEEDPTITNENKYSDVNNSTLSDWRKIYQLDQTNEYVIMAPENER